ncbi:hypothetical protein LENED_011860 [Lentinula edodes]|uniref:Meiotically up-regulated protein Msb1/Mug8 domain-containing protein n=1 Tax=Lentinula edodes TaxID=5353 RepID=A0A1Q3ER79_LENED|nr:hypothetical protein LENED_011860 [Lentinula edodes]
MGFFSRSRSSDTNNNSVDQNTVSSDASPSSVRTLSRKEKKKAAKEQQLSRIPSDEGSLFDGELQQPEERFLPLTLERPFWSSDSDQDYGYLSFEKHVVLGLEQVNRLVDIACEELCSRGGLDTPFIFTTLALDINASAVKRLVKSFLGTCVVLVGREKDVAEKKWREEAKFANMHELGMCLRWGLARITRLINGVEIRGMLNWEHYIQWAEQEQALGYPPEHFRAFLPTLQTPLRLILLTVLSLLARLTAHSSTSGHTPPTLSPLFGPLIFGLGPSGLPFNHTYTLYLRSVNAMEHILLAFIRWQNTPDATGSYSNILTGGTASALGVPPRLKEWIKGYPAMLDTISNYRLSPVSSPEQRHRPRKGARTWGTFECAGFGGDETTAKKLQFDLTESARAARSIKRETLDWSSFTSSGFSRSDQPLNTALQLSVPPQLNLSTSLTPLSSPSSPKTSPPLTPSESKKLRKKAKNGAPTFSWDTEPVLGPEQIIEEAFLDVYCDLLQGSGWNEGLHSLASDNRPCNWALVEFKALPFENAGRPQSEDYTPDSDPRTSTSLLLFEEYRLAAAFDVYSVANKPWKKRFRCKGCGACVASYSTTKFKYSVWAGQFERDEEGKIRNWDLIKPTAHMFYATRMLDFNDELPKWEGYEGQSKRIG